jgi:hypothetical protein
MNPATIPAYLEAVSTDIPMSDASIEWWADAPASAAAGALDAARRMARELKAWRTGVRP